jgi:anaerobic ribonucleoside-triphosphate reductase activating protein
MLKYLYCKEIFKEVPGEITLGISISGCQIRCVGCHSRELWEDKGIILDMTEFQWLLNQHTGITCVCLFGGEHDIDSLTELFMYAHKRVKTAWYSGLDRLPKEHQGILQYLDFYKEGHYDAELGGLDSPITNQRLYHITHPGEKLWDITNLLQTKQNI